MKGDIWSIVRRGDTTRLARVIVEQKGSSNSIPLDHGLLHVAWQRNRPLIGWLLDQGISPDQRDSVGGTVLMYAAADDAIETVVLLISRGADVNARNDNGETAFSYACANDSFRSAKRLHAAGAEVNTVDAGGGSPFDWARCWASKKFYRWLIGIGCRGSPTA
ncbi:MAG: ankyrin repeat domain-containing protein [Tepidisphaeraceae bacterium]